MSSATLTSKGQITLPKSVRDRLGLATGDRVEFVQTESGFLMRQVAGDITALKGVLPRPARPVSIDEMNAAIARMGRGEP